MLVLRALMLCVAVLTLGHAVPCWAATEYKFDKEYTKITFTVTRLGIWDKTVHFTDYDGSLIIDKANLDNSSVSLILRTASIYTESKKLDKKLQNEYWFNAKAYPEIIFKSAEIKSIGDNKAEISGWIYMLGKKRFITMDAALRKEGTISAAKNDLSFFQADTTIYRSDFGMVNSIPIISDAVQVHIEAKFIR